MRKVILLCGVLLLTGSWVGKTQSFSINDIISTTETIQERTYGIAGKKAYELKVDKWIDATGNKTSPIRLSHFKGKYKVIYCFQNWCPGCHSHGLPSLQKLTNAFKGDSSIVFLAVQTVFEGEHTNTYDKIFEVQKKYNLAIPFGHDPGNESTRGRSSIMYNYRTGGTPWFIFIDQENNVVFNDYHIDADKAIAYLKSVTQTSH